MKKIAFCFFIFNIIVLKVFASWPVEFSSGNTISDVFWSSRGSSYWHEGIDMTCDNKGDTVKSTNKGKVYWIQKHNTTNDFVGIGVYEDIGLLYGHLKIDTSINKGDEVEEIGNFLGTINFNYPHLHFEYCGFVTDTDTTDVPGWWGNRATISDPMLYSDENYPLNIEPPQFYWLNIDDIGDETKIGRFIPKGSFSDVFRDSLENQPAIVYGGVQLQVAPAGFSGVWNDNINRKNYYVPTNEVDKDSVTAKTILYSDYSIPKLSMVYKYGFTINCDDVFWQLNADNYNNYIAMSCYGNFEGIYADLTDAFAPFAVNCFTNVLGYGEPDCDINAYWATNMKEGIEGFYVNIMEDTAEVAKSNLKAKYKDGLNWVHLYASSYSTENTNEMGRDSVPVILNNFLKKRSCELRKYAPCAMSFEQEYNCKQLEIG